MHNVLNRLNSLSFTGLGALGVLAVATVLTTVGDTSAPTLTELSIGRLHSLEHATGRNPYTRTTLHVDRARVSLSVEAGAQSASPQAVTETRTSLLVAQTSGLYSTGM